MPQSSSSDFIDSLSSFSKQHRGQRWEGTFSDFLAQILPANPAAMVRSSHEYIYDMLRWHGRDMASDANEAARSRELFRKDLFGIDEPLTRRVEYFKAAAAGSDVGRRLLLLLGPPSGGKRTVAFLLKRGLEEYSRTDEGALYAVKGSPMRENPLNLGLMRLSVAQFLETPWYGSRQMARHLRRQGHVGRKRVRRLMGDCQEFRVVPGIVGSKEPRYAATQRTEDF
jgi:serine protein kinase